MSKVYQTVMDAAIDRAHLRLADCRKLVGPRAIRMHSYAWKEFYIPRHEWHRAWLDYGMQLRSELEKRGRDAG